MTAWWHDPYRVGLAALVGEEREAISFGVDRDDTHVGKCYQKADNRIVFAVVNADYPVFIGTTFLRARFELAVKS